MAQYLKDEHGKFAGSIGDGRDSVPTPMHTTVMSVSETAPTPGLEAVRTLLHDSVENTLQCDSCGGFITGVMDAEMERAERGFVIHCDRCSDPSMGGEYGMWTCVDCQAFACECECEEGPLYCTADLCSNPRGCTYDDGLCEFCGEPADIVADTFGQFQHMCFDCQAHDDNEPIPSCDSCDEPAVEVFEWPGGDLHMCTTHAEFSLAEPTTSCYECERYRNGDISSMCRCPDCAHCVTHCGCGVRTVDAFCPDCESYMGHGRPGYPWTCYVCSSTDGSIPAQAA